MLALRKDSSGDFLADFQLPSILGQPRRKLHTRRYLQGEAPTFARDLQAAKAASKSTNAIRNPVACTTAGSAVVFEDLSAKHHPVYQKDSLLNTNANFDFGAFVKHAAQLKSGKSKATSFIFTFNTAGIYVFKDSANSAKETILAIMAAGGACPTNLIYEAKRYSTLLRVGAALRQDVSLTPDWTFFLASCIGFFVLVLLAALTISYIYNKNWDQDPARKVVQYQARQYKKVKRSDIADEKALVSINSEASSFQFRQQGKADAFKASGDRGPKDKASGDKKKRRQEV